MLHEISEVERTLYRLSEKAFASLEAKEKVLKDLQDNNGTDDEIRDATFLYAFYVGQYVATIKAGMLLNAALLA